MFQKAAVKEHFPTFTDRANLPVLYVICAFAAYVAYTTLAYGRYEGADRLYYIYAPTLLVALSGITVGYGAATRAFRILTKSIISFALFYIVASQVQVSEHIIGDKALADFELNTAWIFAVAFGIAGYFRPSFAIVPLQYMVWQKHGLSHAFALHLEWLDYFTLIETGTFLIVGYLVFAAFRKIDGFDGIFTIGGRTNESVRKDCGGTLHVVDVLILFSIALHYGNYFYAGLIKAVLGEDATFWVLENQTEFLILAAYDSKVLPISFSETLTGWTYELIADVRVFTNFVTISTQLLAVIAILRIKWAILMTLCYDVLHVIIFLTTGIFFWKFIILNLAIVAALGVMHIRTVPRQMRLALVAAVVLSPFVFHIMPSFAWLDSRSSNRIHIVAITEDGTEYNVPSNYFLGLSVTFAQNRLVWPAEGAVPAETWGVSRSLEVMRAGLVCEWGSLDKEQYPVHFAVPKEQIDYFIRRYHVQVLSMLDEDGRFEYDIFPHHIFSMPWYSTEFRDLDKRRIVAYRYESETLCLDYKDGKPSPVRKKLGSFDIVL